MNIWDKFLSLIHQYLSIPSISVVDIIEMVIIAIVFYFILIWIKKTRAWALFKGIIIILIIMILAALFEFNTILWIVSRTISVGIIGIMIIFQPELRRALEQLGRTNMFRGLFGPSAKDSDRMSDKNIEEIIAAVFTMASERTGALICLENYISLAEYEATGIKIDSEISRQLIVNIFENKTPLHDGAVIIKSDRITYATCYLPLSDNQLNKKFGTRHRAGMGLSEVTDAVVIIVSEETGQVSVASGGVLSENIDRAALFARLKQFQKSGSNGVIAEKIKKNRRKDDGAGTV